MSLAESKGMLTKDTTLSVYHDGEYVVLEDLQTLPDLGGDVEEVQVTTMKNSAHRKIAGLKDYGTLEFGFLYGSGASSSFELLLPMEGDGVAHDFLITLPDGLEIEFSAEVAIKINSMDVGDAIKYTLILAVNSEMEWDGIGVEDEEEEE